LGDFAAFAFFVFFDDLSRIYFEFSLACLVALFQAVCRSLSTGMLVRHRGATPSSGGKCVVLAGSSYVLILLASSAALISDGVPYPRQSCIYFKVAFARFLALISGGVL